jgi:hypothetical protein
MRKHPVALIAALGAVSGCGSAWTEAELRAAHLVGACDRVADAAAAQGWRADQGAQATTAARQVALSLASPIPDLDAIAQALAVLDAALAGLATGPGLRSRVHEAQMAVLALRTEMVRRWHRFPVRLSPRI